MNDRRSTDRLLAAWLELEAPASAPDELRTDIHRATARIRPVPPWRARLGGHHMDVITGGAGRRDTRLIPLLALLGLLLAAALAAAWVGSHRNPANDLTVADVSPSASPTATPATPVASPTQAPAFMAISDLALTMPYPIRQVQLGLSGNFVGIANESTNELMRSVYRVSTSTNAKSLVVDDLPVGPSDHASFGAVGGSIIVGHDEGGRALRYDAGTGELLGETPTGTRPLDATVMGSRVWFPIFEDGSVTGIDGRTGEALTVPIPQFNGSGPLALAAGVSELWAVSPSSNTLVGIDVGTGAILVEAELPTASNCGVAVSNGRVWVTPCGGQPTLLALRDSYTAQGGSQPVSVMGGVAPVVFDHEGRAWFATENTSDPNWTTTLVSIDPETLEVGPWFDLGARVGVHPQSGGVWITSGADLYRLRLEDLPSN